METTVPNPDERTDRQKRFELQQIAEIAAFKGFLADLEKRRTARASSSAPNALTRSPYVLSSRRPEHARFCQTCQTWVAPGSHGFVRFDLYPGQPGFAEPQPCPECTGQVGYEETRRRRVFARLMEEAAIPYMARDWDFAAYAKFVQHDPAKGVALRAAHAYAEGKMLKLDPPMRSLFLFGAFGTGKTGLALSILRRRLEGGQPGLYYALADLLDRLRRTYDRARGEEGESAEQIVRQLQDVDLLVLDDLGAERPTDWALEKLFQVVDGRMRNERETIYTSNLTTDELADRLGRRIVERIAYQTWDQEVGGRNLRTTPALEQIKARRNGRAPEPSKR